MFPRILFYLFILMVPSVFSQSNNFIALKKQAFINELGSVKPQTVIKKKKGLGNALLTVYQKHISVLISADCVYALSCSRYSREALNKHGFAAGVLLSADRLSRCSFMCSKDIPSYKFNEEGLAEDNP